VAQAQSPAQVVVFKFVENKFEESQILNAGGKAFEKLTYSVANRRVFAAASDGSVAEVRRRVAGRLTCMQQKQVDELELNQQQW